MTLCGRTGAAVRCDSQKTWLLVTSINTSFHHHLPDINDTAKLGRTPAGYQAAVLCQEVLWGLPAETLTRYEGDAIFLETLMMGPVSTPAASPPVTDPDWRNPCCTRAGSPDQTLVTK